MEVSSSSQNSRIEASSSYSPSSASSSSSSGSTVESSDLHLSSRILRSSTMEVGKTGGRGARRGGERKKSVSKSVKAGLQFPVGRIARYLKEGRYAETVSLGAAVFMAAALEYVASEVLDAAICQLNDEQKRITPASIWKAVSLDVELSKLLDDVLIPGGVGVPVDSIATTEPFVAKTPAQIRNDLVRAPTYWFDDGGVYVEPGIDVDSDDEGTTFAVNAYLGMLENINKD